MLPRTFLLGALLMLTLPSSAAETCVGDTTGPFTPNACADDAAGTARATIGPVSARAGASDGGAAASATLGHPLGATTVFAGASS